MKIRPFRLEVEMTRHNLNYKLLAERAQIAPGILKRVRRGEDVKPELVERIAEAIGVLPEAIAETGYGSPKAVADASHGRWNKGG